MSGVRVPHRPFLGPISWAHFLGPLLGPIAWAHFHRAHFCTIILSGPLGFAHLVSPTWFRPLGFVRFFAVIFLRPAVGASRPVVGCRGGLMGDWPRIGRVLAVLSRDFLLGNLVPDLENLCGRPNNLASQKVWAAADGLAWPRGPRVSAVGWDDSLWIGSDRCSKIWLVRVWAFLGGRTR